MKINMRQVLALIFSAFSMGVQADVLDTTFGPSNTGILVVPIGDSGSGVANSVAIDSSGRIIEAGFAQVSTVNNIALMRTDINGNLDTSFGTSGVVTTLLGDQSGAFAVTTDSLGRIIITGFVVSSGVESLIVARYGVTGSLDATFGTGGVLTVSVGSAAMGNAIIIDGSGNILVAGEANISGALNALVIRVTSSGVLDSTFGTGGIVTQVVGNSSSLNSIAIDSSGNIVVAGISSTAMSNNFLGMRFTSSGSLDTTFNSTGYVTNAFMSSTVNAANAVAITSINGVLLAGVFSNSGANNIGMSQYTTAGALDSTFGSGGLLTDTLGMQSGINDGVFDTSGRLVAAISSDNHIAVGRYNSNGTVDGSFASTGKYALTIGSVDLAASLALQTDGKIVVAGTSDGSFALARLNSDTAESIHINNPVNGSTITTPSVTVSGTSSVASAQVQVLINGALFTTVTTDGSGNWNAGATPILNNGMNTIRANLIVSSTVVAAYVSQFTVNSSPVIVTTTPANQSTITTLTTPISGTSSLASTLVIVLVDSAYFAITTTDSFGNWSAGTSLSLALGTHTISASLISSAGSVFASCESIFTRSL